MTVDEFRRDFMRNNRMMQITRSSGETAIAVGLDSKREVCLLHRGGEVPLARLTSSIFGCVELTEDEARKAPSDDPPAPPGR